MLDSTTNAKIKLFPVFMVIKDYFVLRIPNSKRQVICKRDGMWLSFSNTSRAESNKNKSNPVK